MPLPYRLYHSSEASSGHEDYGWYYAPLGHPQDEPWSVAYGAPGAALWALVEEMGAVAEPSPHLEQAVVDQLADALYVVRMLWGPGRVQHFVTRALEQQYARD